MSGNTTKSDRFWNWRARKFDEHARRDESYGRAFARFKKYLQADDTVLDYGCGGGVMSFMSAPHVKEVHAIDTSAGMIEVANERARERNATNVHFAQRSLFDTALATESFDMILAFNILHLVEDAKTAVARARELLKPNGLLVSVTPCLGDAGVMARMMLPLISKIGILSYLTKFKTPQLHTLMSDCAFDIVHADVDMGSIPSAFIVARKR